MTIEENIISNDKGIVANLLRKECLGERSHDEQLNDYVELAVHYASAHALREILAYEPSNPELRPNIDRIIDEEKEWTCLNYIAEEVVNEDVCFDMMQILLNAGADPNIPGHDGYTPLHNIAVHRNFNIINLLLEHGANPNLKTDYEHSCFEALLFCLIEDMAETGLPGEGIEDEVLTCMPVFLKHHAEAYWSFYTNAEDLGFTRVLQVLDEAEVYPMHIQATYVTKESITKQLKALPFEQFKLHDASNYKPSDIAKKYNAERVVDALKGYEAMYQRRQLMETNYECSGESLSQALRITRVHIAGYLGAHEFGFFTSVTNMHLARDNGTEQNVEQRLKVS